MKVCILGLWHQGVVGAACFAAAGCEVVGADHDETTITALRKGKAPLFEPGLDELLDAGLRANRLTFMSDVAAAVRGIRDIVLMQDTPVNDNDESDLCGLFDTVREIAPNLEDDAVLLVTSQVPVGTCDDFARVIRSARPQLKFGIAYMPENLRLGQAIERFRKPPLPVIGADDPATLDRVEKMLAPFETRWEHVNLCTAEMTKHALNGFLALSITFANELGNLCDELGADGHRLAEVLRLEPRIGSKAMLFPGLGFSGGTLARDVQTLRTLGDLHGVETSLLDGAWTSNQAQNRSVIRRLKRAIGALQGRRICVLGLTYKPDTSTLRRSAALEVISELIREKASIAASDPRADRGELGQLGAVAFFADPYEAAVGAEAVLLMTPWKEYRELDFQRLRACLKRPVLIDTANLWHGDALIAQGFEYFDIGRGRQGGKHT